MLFSIKGQEFGKNIAQYHKFDWHYIKTENFDIYYYDGAKTQAEFVAYHAEEAYKKIKLFIGWGLNERRNIIVYNSHNEFQQTNIIPFYIPEGVGGITELGKNRMIIPYEGSLQQFKHVIYHELVHVFINDGIYGGSMMAAMVSIVKNRVIIPSWMNEGLAEYLADSWSTNSDMWLRDLAINSEQIPDIPYLRGYLEYRGGQSVWQFITNKWGEEIIAEIFHNIKFKKSVNKGIETSLGIDIKELSSQWHKYIKKQYWPDLEAREDIQDIARQLTNHIDLYNTYNISPEVSPDGNQIAIYSNKNGVMSIYIISLEDGEFIKKIISGGKTSKFEELHFLKPGVTWSPDGEKLAFAVKSGSSDALFIVDINNPKKHIKKEFNLKGIYRPKWNPINNSIAFIGYSNFASDVFIYNVDEDSLLQMTKDIYSDIQISWAPDGKELLLVSDRSDNIILSKDVDILSISNDNFNNYDIYKLDLNKSLERLTATPFNEISPSFSPDGNQIAYISDESGINNIYITNDRFITSKSITNILTGIMEINWYAQDEIIFTGFYNSGYDIFRMSNIDYSLENEDIISPAKWKSNINYPLLREESEYIPNQDGDYLQYHQFTNITPTSSKGENIKDFSLLDSLGRHISYKYKTRFTLDYLSAYYDFDVLNDAAQGMGIFSFSDILGNHSINLYTSLIIDFKETDFLLDYRNLKHRVDWGIMFYNNAYTLSYSFTEEFITQYILRDIGLNSLFLFPFSKFSRIQGGVLHNYLEKKEIKIRRYDRREFSDTKESYNLSSYFLKYVWDNTTYFSGNKTFLQYEVSPNIKSNDFVYKKFKFDTRSYIALSRKSYIILASRLFISSSTGRDARLFGIGGSGYNTFFHSDNALINPIYREKIMQGSEYQYMFMNNFQYPIRGYHIAQKFGKNSIIANLELRLPFLIYYFPAIKYFGQLFGVLFVDAGVAWNGHYPQFSDKKSWENIDAPEGWIMSYGFGPRFNFFNMSWKLDYAWQYSPYQGRISSRNWYLSVGLDF